MLSQIINISMTLVGVMLQASLLITDGSLVLVCLRVSAKVYDFIIYKTAMYKTAMLQLGKWEHVLVNTLESFGMVTGLLHAPARQKSLDTQRMISVGYVCISIVPPLSVHR